MNNNLRAELDHAILTCSKGESYDFFKFAATYVATLGNGVTQQNFVGDCFANTTMTFTKLDPTSVQIEINAQNPTSLFCSVLNFYCIFNFHLKKIGFVFVWNYFELSC